MRGNMRVVGAVLAVALVAVAMAPMARADMDRPTWTVGDSWAYEIRGGFPGVADAVPGTGSLRMEVVGTDSIKVGGMSYSSYGLEVAVNITAGSIAFNIPGEMWVRTSDLAVVRTTFTTTFSIPPLVVESVFVTTNDPPEKISWPLTTGKTWSTTSTVTTQVTAAGQPPLTTTETNMKRFSVEAARDITVPAGAFSTTPVRTDLDGGYQMNFWSPQAGNFVRQQTFDGLDAEVGGIELTSYNYQAGAQFLGLPLFLWFIIALVAIIAVVIAVGLRRRKRPVPVAMPPPVGPPAAPPEQGPPETPPPSLEVPPPSLPRGSGSMS